MEIKKHRRGGPPWTAWDRSTQHSRSAYPKQPDVLELSSFAGNGSKKPIANSGFGFVSQNPLSND
jgi:hypothetical protein